MGDAICDKTCHLYPNCNYDYGDCSTCALNCERYYGYFIAYASQHKPIELVDIFELCKIWKYMKKLSDYKTDNCTEAFYLYDVNNDGYISFYESMLAAHKFFGFTKKKVKQVDCSMCMNNASLYY